MEYFDQLETRAPADRERDLFAKLPGQIENAQKNAPYFRDLLKGVAAEEIGSREALARLPLTYKEDLIEVQKKNRPFGGLLAVPVGQVARVFCSPGPIYEVEGRRKDYGRFVRPLYAAGFRSGELIYNTFSYHFTPAGLLVDSAARDLGCAVFPAGVGQTELQVSTIADLRPNGYVGTPSFLKIILEKASEMGVDISFMSKALVGAEALPPSLRAELKQKGVQVFQCYATADLGVIAYESEALEGMILAEDIIVELVRPGTGDPVAEGEVGEIVVTTLTPEYPLIRFATGDLSAVLPGPSPCGRTHTRIKGWMGRANQTTKVKAMFVHPSQVAEVLKHHAGILKGRLVVDRDASGQDRMTLHSEVAGGGSAALAEAVIHTLRDVCKLRGEVKFVAPGSLPNDGKVIDDIRKYD